MINRLAAVALLAVIALTACGRLGGSGSGAPSSEGALYSSRVTLSDVSRVLPDANNWWVGPPTFDVRPLNSATRDDANVRGLTVRFMHLGTAEFLLVNYQVETSTTFTSAYFTYEKAAAGTGVSGPKAGDQVLYYNRKLAAGPTVYNNLAYVQAGATIISLIWSHVNGFASTNDVGAIAKAAVANLKNGPQAPPTPLQATDASLLAPPGTEVTLLGATRLPIEVEPQILLDPNPLTQATLFRNHGVTDFVFGDYALNDDTHMEVLTVGISFPNQPTAGTTFIDQTFGASNLTATGEGGGYNQATGQYVYGFGSGSRAVLVICRSSVEGEEAGRGCESPMAALVPSWHEVMGLS